MSLQLAAKRPVLAAVGLVLIVLIYVAYLLFAPDAIRYSGEIRRGNQFVAEIEAYRRAKGRLPISVKDLGGAERESDRLFYQSCGGTHYIVWFGTVLGESMTYDSAKRRWESTNGTCQ